MISISELIVVENSPPDCTLLHLG